MDSSFQGAVLDPVKCNKLSMEDRREIVYELASWSDGAAELLQTWSRQDILEILCSEMGKERKYTGLTKLKIIEHLLKVVSEKKSMDPNGGEVCEQSSSPSSTHNGSKRPRKAENPSGLPASSTDVSALNGDSDLNIMTYCKNYACKARLSKEDSFCKRCSCCICLKYDDNKDPSLWLTCSSEPPFLGDSCNLSCHLECALKHERSGIARNGLVAQLDGSFYCVSCGKMNDLMRCWRKQLMVAKETRRVDILCYRISLSQKLVGESKKYREISEIIDDAVKKLEAEVGTLTGVPVKQGRGIVNRLSSGQQVQRLCASAINSFDSMICSHHILQDSNTAASNIVRVEDISLTSVTNSSLLSDPSSVEDETNNFNSSNDALNLIDEPKQHSSDGQVAEATSTDNNGSNQNKKPTPRHPETGLPVNPSQLENSKDVRPTKKRGLRPHNKVNRDDCASGEGEEEHTRSSSKKRCKEENGPSKLNLEYYVKVLRWLECDGHIEKGFRQKFLTWYSIVATPQETRIVKAFVDTLVDDPASLSEQLIDTFGEIISRKRSSAGFCLKLWH